MRRPLKLLVALACALAAGWVVFPFPRERLAEFPAGGMITDREGQPLRIRLGPEDIDCRPGYCPRSADWIVQALIAAEDERFYRHPGIDPLALLRALGQNLAARRGVSGASTISTQVIRLMQPRDRTLRTKLVEAFRALQLERLLTKDEVLLQYLNRAPFGGNVVGIEAASRRYFAKGPHDLSLAEAALLAGLPQSPSRFRPDRHLARARVRQAYVLGRMVDCGMISLAQRNTALRQRVAVRAEQNPFAAPHFCDFVAARRPESREAVRTTLDPALQKLAEMVLARAMPGRPANGGGVVILDVASGAIRAMVGSPDYFHVHHDGQVNGAWARRSAGSTLKPFVFAEALDRGLVTPRTVLADVPKLFADYEPVNFDETFSGLVTAHDALVLSLNLPAIDLERRVGQPALYRTLHELGLETLDRKPEAYGLGLVLGSGEVRLLDLANAYAALARGGVYKPFRCIEGEPVGAGLQVFSPEAAWLVAESLGGEERALDATGHRADVKLPRIAWKTGTSSGFRDAWTVAFNPEYVVGVWIGNMDGGPAPGLVGKLAAAPVAWDIFRRLYARNDAPWFDRPAGLGERSVCSISGQPPGPYCEHQVTDWYIRGASTFDACKVHQHGPEPEWPPAIAAFLARQGGAGQESAGLKITTPAQGSNFKLVEDWPSRQEIQLASTRAGHWFIDTAYLGEGDRLLWPLARGRHDIVCADPAGQADRVVILVE